MSAIGSSIFPRVVTWLYFLAYQPSIKSVAIAIKHKIPATILTYNDPSIRKKGAEIAIKILKRLSVLGKLSIIFFCSIGKVNT